MIFVVANAFTNMFHVFEPVVQFLRWVLTELHSVGLPWAVAIITLTVIVRIILFPLTYKQFKSAQAMQALQPHLKELQRKHKGDKQRLQQETMRLYQENKVNPFASCLPMLLQLPVFICLYYAIKHSHQLMHAGFLWMTLGKPDPYYVLLIIYVVSQLVSTELMLSPQTDRQQKMLMRLMPLFFVFILRRFPSGLFIYWITTNIWTVGQQLIIRRSMPPVVVSPASAGGDEPAGRPAKRGTTSRGGKPKKQGRFMSALMAAQDQREQQLASRSKATGKPGAKPGAASAGKPGAKKVGGAGKATNKPSRGGASGGRPAKKASGRQHGPNKP
jgi:YidC/Oxa1 family membrane protein insertase